MGTTGVSGGGNTPHVGNEIGFMLYLLHVGCFLPLTAPWETIALVCVLSFCYLVNRKIFFCFTCNSKFLVCKPSDLIFKDILDKILFGYLCQIITLENVTKIHHGQRVGQKLVNGWPKLSQILVKS